MTKKIFITGCARSGTTLLARLFHAFENCQVVEEETSLESFCEYNAEDQTADFIVGKRNQQTIFSNTLSSREIEKQLELIDKHNIIIINCVRDGRQVVDSWVEAWGVYDPQAWINSILQAEEFQPRIATTVKFEHLIKSPDVIQKHLRGVVPGLKQTSKFSEYPEFVPEESFKSPFAAYRPRRIQQEKKRVPKTYLRRPNDLEYFKMLLSQLNYTA